MTAAAPIDELYGRRILVTGANGFIGGALIQRLTATDCTLIRASRSPLPSLTASAANVLELIGEPSDPTFWQRALVGEDVDMIFHLAGQTSAYVAENNPELDHMANVEPLRHLLDIASDLDRGIDVLYAGTVTQAGLTETLPVGEDVQDDPVTEYDRNKLMAEQMLEHAARRGTVRGVTLRLPNVFGPGTTVGRSDRGVLNKIIATALKGDEISIYGDGHELRDYLFIDDVVEAFVLTSLAMDRASGHHFVLGTGNGHSLREVFELVARQVGNAIGKVIRLGEVPWPEGTLPIERRNFVADPSAIREAAGWQARVGLTDGVNRTIAAFREQGN